jgi:hypothetical protein
MLNSMDSREYSQWMAFERAHGPINGEWDAEVFSNIQEQLQTIAYLLGQAHFTDKTHKRGPIEKPERYPRPGEFMERLGGKSPVDNADKDEAEWLPLTEDELLEVQIDPTETEGVE